MKAKTSRDVLNLGDKWKLTNRSIIKKTRKRKPNTEKRKESRRFLTGTSGLMFKVSAL